MFKNATKQKLSLKFCVPWISLNLEIEIEKGIKKKKKKKKKPKKEKKKKKKRDKIPCTSHSGQSIKNAVVAVKFYIYV